jgi:AcrR family transcriptional regulator
VEIRRRILQAALDCFTEDGYDRTTVARVRERSGVSNGALFHHFANKEAIADALYLDAMQSVQDDYWAVLDEHPASLRDAVGGLVTHMLSWIESHPAWARFLYAQGHLDWSSAAGSELAALNSDLAQAYRSWLNPFIATGEVRDLPMVVIVAVVTGPAHALAQRWLAGQLPDPLLDYAEDLTDAAVAALSGSPTAKSRRPRPPRQGRIRLELVGDDGTILAEGDALATLTTHRETRKPRAATRASRG